MIEKTENLARFDQDGYLLLKGLLQPENYGGLLRRVEEAVDRRTKALYDTGKISKLHEKESEYIPEFLARSRSNPDGIDSRPAWYQRYKDSGITTE